MSWAYVTVAYFPVWLSITFFETPGGKINTHTHTHTHTHTYIGVCDKDWINYLSIFAVNLSKVFVARIKSIILSIFQVRVKATDYQFRFLESTQST